MTRKLHHLKVYVYLFIILLFSLPVSVNANIAEFDRLYTLYLEKYWHSTVTIHDIETTVFDYSTMSQDANKEDSLYSRIRNTLLGIDPENLVINNDTKAFWINAYNFAAMALIVENYPVTSIRDFKISLLKHPWSKKAIQIGAQTYSLEQIEKEILLKQFHDHRIVFAVSCAAISCPDRIAEPFRGDILDKQLDSMITNFFANPVKGLRYNKDTNELTLSWILKKDRHLFGGTKRGLLEFVCIYVEQSICNWMQENEVEVRYLNHDWTLNDIALAER
jgi:hypothetical protein